MNIGLFCAASQDIEKIYVDAANEFGCWIGQNGHSLIYGGASLGLMEITAKVAKDNGAKVVGIIPKILIQTNRISSLPHEYIYTENLSDRKDEILRLSDITIALPGGIGTLDELFHVIAAHTIGYHTKKVVFYNVNGFWDDLLLFLDKLKNKKFIRHYNDNIYYTASSIDELNKIIGSRLVKFVFT